MQHSLTGNLAAPSRCFPPFQGARSARHSVVSRAQQQQRDTPSSSPANELVLPANAGPIQLGPALEGRTTRRGVLSRALVLGAGMAACPCCNEAALASGNAKFDYGTLSGPQSWGGVCQAGTRQSPIDLPRKSIVASVKKMYSGAPASAAVCRPASIDVRGYKPVKPTILNTGVGTMQVNFDKGTQMLKCGGADLELIQYHFHTPSEHSFDGERTAMEVHLVHRNVVTGGLAVLGVLMETGGTPNTALTTTLKYAPPKARESAPCPAIINPVQLLPRPGDWQYVRYTGSLTTPGCSEGVDWYVMLATTSISPEQVLQFSQYVGGGKSFGQNARPIQLLNGRAFDLQYDCVFG